MKTELTDGQLLLRPYRAEDTQALYDAVRESIEELALWMPWCHADYAIEESRAFIMSRDEARAKHEDYSFGIFDAQTLRYLGGVGLNHFSSEHGYANLGYWVRTGCTGRGIASAAARLTAHFGFEELGLHRIEIVVAVENTGSRRVAEKTGAMREGVLRKRLLLHGQPVNAVMHSLVAEDLGLASSKRARDLIPD
ncbi:MAG TPA: GNAT family protein [Pyrinomonadaceae bacterium]|jgi:RimJ/RimL family protein N-acetyltransferase|nr:GNAT family protein [Pyrinomonadaceae bacterium]